MLLSLEECNLWWLECEYWAFFAGIDSSRKMQTVKFSVICNFAHVWNPHMKPSYALHN